MPVGPPLFILGLPRSCGTVVCAMLGQHPQMFSLLESRLLRFETMREWWRTAAIAPKRAAGLLRGVAEVIFDCQTEHTIERARHWLWRRRGWETGDVFRLLADRLQPLHLAEKTPIGGAPDTVIRESLRRRLRVFPDAMFLHLVRHPMDQCWSRMQLFFTQTRNGPPGRTARASRRLLDEDSDPPVLDPQFVWHKVNAHILRFLEPLPAEQHLLVRCEDLLTHPDDGLRRVARWMTLRTDPCAIEEMKHPERSPFAYWGPRNARGGGDGKFFRMPQLRCARLPDRTLKGPLPWRADQAGFSPQVSELARHFGYS